jgi:hypothetical protein
MLCVPTTDRRATLTHLGAADSTPWCLIWKRLRPGVEIFSGQPHYGQPVRVSTLGGTNLMEDVDGSEYR